jgi:hypothetical protein
MPYYVHIATTLKKYRAKRAFPTKRAAFDWAIANVQPGAMFIIKQKGQRLLIGRWHKVKGEMRQCSATSISN